MRMHLSVLKTSLTGKNGNILASHCFTNAPCDGRFVDCFVGAVVKTWQASIAAGYQDVSASLVEILSSRCIGANDAKEM